MTDQTLSPSLQEFISRHIGSVVQAELLLLAQGSAPRRWSAAEIAAELRVEPAGARSQADALCSRGLLRSTGESDPRYWYEPSSDEIQQGVLELARAYPDRRVSIISFIYSRPPDPLKLFADAFRIVKDKQNG